MKIQAPVVMAAFIRPFPNTCFNLGCISKFWRPPWTEIKSLGSSSCQSFTMRCSRESGLVSYDTRMYCEEQCVMLPLNLLCNLSKEWLSFAFHSEERVLPFSNKSKFGFLQKRGKTEREFLQKFELLLPLLLRKLKSLLS